AQGLIETSRVPLLGIGIFRNVLGHQVFDHGVAHIGDGFVHGLVAHQFETLLENHLALVIHHVVELEQVLADVEVACLDFLLRLFQRLVDPGMNDRLVLLQSEFLQHSVKLVGSENPHEVVFKRQEEFGMTRIALPTRATAQLVINAAAFVPLGAEYKEPAGAKRLFLKSRNLSAYLVSFWTFFALAPLRILWVFLSTAHFGLAAELNIGASASHIRGNCNRTRHARLRDDIRFLLVVAGIEDGKHLGLGGAVITGIKCGKGVGIRKIVLLPTGFPQHFSELLRLFDRSCTNQNRLAALLAILDQRNDRPIFFSCSAVHLIVVVKTN